MSSNIPPIPPSTPERVRHDLPFGGITVVFGGDFQQILPVIECGGREDIVSACLQRSRLWLDIKPLLLKKNMRLDPNDQESVSFAQWLLEVGRGKNTQEDDTVRLRDGMALAVQTPEALIDAIYPNIAQPNATSNAYFLDRTILSARNKDVQEMNQQILDHFPGPEIVHQSADSVE